MWPSAAFAAAAAKATKEAAAPETAAPLALRGEGLKEWEDEMTQEKSQQQLLLQR